MRSLRRVIAPGEPWDLGYLDGTERKLYSGHEHRRCNRQTTYHRLRQVRRAPRPISAGKVTSREKGEAEGMSSPLRKSNPWLLGQQ
jgi:anti-sigma factor RsiW